MLCLSNLASRPHERIITKKKKKLTSEGRREQRLCKNCYLDTRQQLQDKTGYGRGHTQDQGFCDSHTKEMWPKG